MYHQIKKFLFKKDPEKVHYWVMRNLHLFAGNAVGSWFLKQNLVPKNRNLEKEIFGLNFKNHIGLAAGFDKDAKYQIGDLHSSSFKEIWKSKSYQNFRKNILTNRNKIDICQNCTEGTKVWA